MLQTKTALSWLGLVLLAGLALGCARRPPPTPLEAGIRALDRGKYGAAVKYLEQASRERPNQPAILSHLGIAYLNTDQFDLAADAFKRAASLSPNDPQPLEYLASVYVRTERWVEAREALSAAYKRAPKSARVMTSLALVHLRGSNIDMARSSLLYALSLDPVYPPALYNLGMLNHEWLKNEAQAEIYLLKYLDVAGDDSHVRDARQALKAIAAARARMPEPAAKGTGAASHASQPPPAQTENVPAAGATAEASLALARNAIKNDSLDEALVRLRETVREYPQNTDVLWELALLYDDHIEDPANAAKTYRQFIATFPRDSRAKVAKQRLEKISFSSGGTAAVKPGTIASAPSAAGTTAVPHATKLFFKKPAKTNTRLAVEAFQRGARYQKASDWNRAVYYYTRAIEHDETFLNAYFNLGLVFHEADDFERARDSFIYALQLKPDMARTRYMLGMTYRDLHRNDAAIKELDATLRLDPTYAEAHLLLALIYQEESGDTDLIRTHFARYLELAPTGHGARAARKWLEDHESR